MKNKVDISNRKAVHASLEDFCVFSDNVDYLEVTEWTNGGGYDINIYYRKNQLNFKLTSGQFDALKKCIEVIENENN
jgi:hypothetical protein